MGCFSYICKKSGEPILSSSFNGDVVHLFLIEDGKVIEHMYGKYDSYGCVFKEDMSDSYSWEKEWDEIVDMHFNDSKKDGIAAILGCYYDGVFPTEISEDDPDQGWGKHKIKFKNPLINKKPFHDTNPEQKTIPAKSKVKYKVWMSIEKISEDDDGEEVYEDLKGEETLSVTECESVEDAIKIMNEVHDNYFQSIEPFQNTT